MKRNGLIAVVCTLGVLVCAGCMAQGHRNVEFTFGTTIGFEDRVEENSEGVDIYRAGFDEESGIIKAFLGWLMPPAKTEPEAEVSDGG